jgi:hypothetical protein
MKKITLILPFLLLISSAGFAQGEIDDQQKVFYRNEKSAGILLNSTGWGVSLRYGKRINFLNKRLYEVDFNSIKHHKEIKATNPYFPSNRGFVFGKLNAFFNIRGGIGHQREVFKKIDQGGIAIRYFYSAGPALGFYKPIYYEVLYPIPQHLYEYEIKIEKFSAAIHKPTDIYARASFFKGFDEIKFVPGGYTKFGLNFEYSKIDRVIHALEVGFTFEAYTKKIPIMASEDNKQFFFALFVSYRFGKIVDPKHQPITPDMEELMDIF